MNDGQSRRLARESDRVLEVAERMWQETGHDEKPASPRVLSGAAVAALGLVLAFAQPQCALAVDHDTCVRRCQTDYDLRNTDARICGFKTTMTPTMTIACAR